MLRFPLFTSLLLCGPVSAAAQVPETLGAETCFPIQEITKRVHKMDELKASKRDTVALRMEAEIEPEDGEALPDRLEIRDAGRVTRLPLNEQNRTTSLLDTVRTASEAAEFCIVDPAREGRLREEVGYDFDLGLNVGFIETPGHHSLEQIEDGLKDGRSHFKKMMGAMGFLIPKFTHVAIASDEDVPPAVFVTKDGVDLGQPEFETFDDVRLYEVDQIETLGGDGLRIVGPYRMSPSPDAKTVARFSGNDEDNEG